MKLDLLFGNEIIIEFIIMPGQKKKLFVITKCINALSKLIWSVAWYLCDSWAILFK